MLKERGDNMILPTTNISIMMVRNATECPSTDLGTLVAKAKIGGKSGYAFNITENGGGTWDGSLILDDKGFPSAYPYWNIFSANSPGYWELPDSPDKPCYLRLKHNKDNRYYYSLGSFAGYNSGATPPIAEDTDVSFRQGESVLNKEARIKVHMGTHDWTNSISGVNAARVVVYTDNNLDTVFASSKAIINGLCVLRLTVNTTGVNSKTYPMVVQLGYATNIGTDKEDFNAMCIIPMISNLTINVIGATIMVVHAKITAANGFANIRGTASTNQFGQSVITNNAKNTARELNGYYLKRVTTVCINANGTEVYNKTRNPDYRDFPSDPSGFKEFIDTVPLSAYIPSEAWNTITNNSCVLTATLEYDKL